MLAGAAVNGAQLPLGVRLNGHTTFERFFPGPNRLAFDLSQEIAHNAGAQQQLYLWGPPSSGKTHLLQAICHAASGRSVAYLPLLQALQHEPSLLQGLEQVSLLCLDDFDRLAWHLDWEDAAIGLLDRARERGCALVIAARQNPASADFHLNELLSRLFIGPVLPLSPLTEEERLPALIGIAERRGLELPPEAARYLLNRTSRSLSELATLLEQLDHASLAAQRRLTIPFVRQVLMENDPGSHQINHGVPDSE